MSQEHFEALLTRLGEVIGLPDLKADANGNCQLVFDETTTVHVQFDPLEDWVIISSDIGIVPSEGGAEILGKLLSANLFWIDTRGCTIALELGTGTIVLMTRARLVSLGYEDFSLMLNQFIATTEVWTQRVREWGTGDATQPPVKPAGEDVEEAAVLPPVGMQNLV